MRAEGRAAVAEKGIHVHNVLEVLLQRPAEAATDASRTRPATAVLDDSRNGDALIVGAECDVQRHACGGAMNAAGGDAMMNERFQGAGGVSIYARSWRPEAEQPRAVVVIAHGFNSHSGYYAWVGEQLAANRIAVYALDHRGRGNSGGDRFYVENISEYVDDLAMFVNVAKSREPGLPVFVLGHSAGGVIASVYALEHQSEIQGLICESFAFEVYAPKLALKLLKGLSRIAPHAHVYKLPNKEFSRDPRVVEALNKDPLIARESQPAATVAAFARADERLAKEFPMIKLPVMILHGTADKVTKPSGSQFFFDTVGSDDKVLKLYDGHAHDLLNDIGKERVLADVIEWIDTRIARSERREPIGIVQPTPGRSDLPRH